VGLVFKINSSEIDKFSVNNCSVILKNNSIYICYTKDGSRTARLIASMYKTKFNLGSLICIEKNKIKLIKRAQIITTT
jgi:hypothetical protein